MQYNKELTKIKNIYKKNKFLPDSMDFKKILIISVVLILFLIIGGYIWETVESKRTWRAVFLTNNQVYFGKLSYRPFCSTAKLEDIYYLQISEPLHLQDGINSKQTEIKIVKFGNEIHAPKDKLMIPKSQILYWEDLRDDSVIVKAILERKKSK